VGVTPDDTPGYARLRRRRNLVLGIAIAALLAAAGGLLLSTTIKSPAQVAAETKPPAVTRLTAPVQLRVISVSVLAQGVVAAPPEVSQPSAGTAGGTGQGDVQPIVTRIYRHPGSTLQPGAVVLEVAGQPVFVLKGSEPAYRSLMPGESGKDVAELQAALGSLGYLAGADASGVFGAGTSAAVAAYYQAIGYTAPAAPPVAGAKRSHGVMVPLSDIMFVPRFPARVVKLGAPVGHVASGSLLTVSMGSPTIQGQLNPANGALVRRGMRVTITNPVTQQTTGGSVRSVGSTPGSKGSIIGGLYLPMRIKPDQPLPASMVGQDVSLAITAAGSGGPVLAVPEAAVFAHADGRIYVAKVTGPDSQVDVPVRVGITGDGWVQVTPASRATLRAGDSVVTGENYLTSPTGAAPGAGRGGSG
jgi:peptidoglycan hydrolase-like protein with peptidoglycan-binding domain